MRKRREGGRGVGQDCTGIHEAITEHNDEFHFSTVLNFSPGPDQKAKLLCNCWLAFPPFPVP